MAYDGVIMQRALARFDQARQRRAAEMEQRRRMLYARQPRLEEIERTLRGTMSRIVAAAAKKGEDPLPAIRALRDENLALQQERAQLLTELGYPADYLEDKPACPLCGDTGYDKKGVCRCLRQYYAREQLQELSRLLPLGEARFETFRFDLYDSAEWEGYGISPRANMERNFDVCRDFACQFSRGGGDLLLSGGTGLGKTFLTGEASAGYGADDIKLLRGAGCLERLTNDQLQGVQTKVLVDVAAVDGDSTGAVLIDANPGHGGLTTAGAVKILFFALVHSKLPPN